MFNQTTEVDMDSIRDYPKIEREFFEEKNGKIKYKDYCINCSQECKQSHKVIQVMCGKKDIVHTPKEYLAEIENNKLDFPKIAKQIGIHSRTLRSMLLENKDMTFDAYDKLDKLLFSDSKRNEKKKK